MSKVQYVFPVCIFDTAKKIFDILLRGAESVTNFASFPLFMTFKAGSSKPGIGFYFLYSSPCLIAIYIFVETPFFLGAARLKIVTLTTGSIRPTGQAGQGRAGRAGRAGRQAQDLWH